MFSRRFYLPRLLALLGCAFVLVPREDHAQPTASSPFSPYQHRALYLYHFATFTTWPKAAFATTNSPFVIATLGDDPFGKNLDVIRNKRVQGRPLVLKNFRNLDEVGGCHLLFIAETDRRAVSDILKALESSPILTVAETDGFLETGGMINLMMVNKTLSFEINQNVGEKSHLKFDSRLLRLARRVMQ